MAVLSYLDFFSTGVQRVALSTAANMCKKLPSDGNNRRKLIQPICVSGWALLQPLRMSKESKSLPKSHQKSTKLHRLSLVDGSDIDQLSCTNDDSCMTEPSSDPSLKGGELDKGGKIEHNIQNLRPKSSGKKWIYMIPLIVLLFFFILWVPRFDLFGAQLSYACILATCMAQLLVVLAVGTSFKS